VKPANGSAGHGVTTGIVTSFDLVRAAVTAAAFGPNLVVEQQVEGNVYRLLYLNGKLLDAVLRKSPAVVADGSSSIRKLIQLENRARLKAGRKFGQVLLSIDLDMRHTLAKQGLSLSSVPKKGTVVTLKTVINENSVADNVSATSLLCKSIIEDGAAAAAAVGVRLAGVDIVTRDPGVPLAQSGGVILEVNTTPGYHYHYYQRDGGVAVAIPILSWLLSEQPKSGEVLMGSRGAQRLDAVMRTGRQ
jgi:cyanophycin synthetase